jgi:hypothetical protein
MQHLASNQAPHVTMKPRSSSSSTRRSRRSSSSSTAGGYSLTNRARPSAKAVFPERYTTTFTNSINCYFPIGRLTAAAGNYAAVMVNSAYSPFNAASYQLITAPGSTFSMNGVLVQGDTMAQQAMGYSSMAALYTNYRVLHYSLKATFMPQNVADTSEMVLIPVGFEEIPSTSAAAVNLRVMASQPRSIVRVCETAVPARENTLVLQQNGWDLVGMRKQQWIDLPPTSVTTFPANQAYVGIFVQQLNGTNNAAVCTLALELQQTIEFTDLLNPIS